MTGRMKEPQRLYGGEWLVSFVTKDDPRETLDAIGGKEARIEIKRNSGKRSRDANAMCWALCADIGRAMTPPEDKDEIYRKAIRAVGIYTEARVCVWDIETIRSRWSAHGTGWFIDIADDSGPGHKKIHLYYGTSTYTADEMRILLDWLIDQARQMEITIPLGKDEEERLLAQWGKASCKASGSATSAAS